jgi:hypothetical protein
VLSTASWHTFWVLPSLPVPPRTQRSPLGQSLETWQASWQREKTQASGALQSLLSEHAWARPPAEELLQLETAAAMASARARQRGTPTVARLLGIDKLNLREVGLCRADAYLSTSPAIALGTHAAPGVSRIPVTFLRW